MKDKRNDYRPRLPKWFNKDRAEQFREFFNESIFDSIIDAMNEDKTFLAEKGYDPNERRITWLKTGKRSIMIKHKESEIDKYKEFEKEFIENIKALAPPPKKPTKIKKFKKPVCFIINPADTHFGKLGYDYNMQKAKDKFINGIYGIVQKALLFEVEKIIFVGGNDVLHIDNTNRTTTAGTPQDTDGTWVSSFEFAFGCYIDALEMLSNIAPVHYVHCMSNHDYKLGWTFSKSIEAYFSTNKNISFDNSELHRKYAQYGSSLIGLSHGDGAKDIHLVDLMKREAKRAWSKCRFGYWILGHLHHKINKTNRKETAKEHGDVTVFRKPERVKDNVNIHYCHSISGTDTWHEKAGYTGGTKAMDGFIIDPIQGMIAQLTQYV